jgi:hypothetical protein
MAISLATVGGKITASFMNLIVTAVNRNQSTQVIPTSIAGTGTTSITSGGTVNVTGTSAIRINGVFTSLYSAYLVVFDFSIFSTAATLSARLATGGTDDIGTNYVSQILQGAGASATAATSGVVSSFLILNTASAEASGEIRLYNPAKASAARILANTVGVISGTSLVVQNLSGRHNLTSGYDGITISPSTGTISGTISIFGMNNG